MNLSALEELAFECGGGLVTGNKNLCGKAGAGRRSLLFWEDTIRDGLFEVTSEGVSGHVGICRKSSRSRQLTAKATIRWELREWAQEEEM